MREYLAEPNERTELAAIIARARRRWRVKVALRGAAILAGGTLLLLLASVQALEYLRFGPAAILTFRIVVVLGLVGLVGWFVVRPLIRMPAADQLALYLEELDSSFDAALVSAVEAAEPSARRRPPSALDDETRSPALIERVIATAVGNYQAHEQVRHAERRQMRRFAGALLGAVAVAAALVSFGPSYLRHGLSALFTLARSVEAASPYRIDVEPGDATVPRGSDQIVRAALVGFESDRVDLMVRSAAGGTFESVPLIPGGEAGLFEGMLFDVAGATDYFVQADGVRSPLFSLQVVDLPFVERLELEYRFPAYTGLEPQKIDRGGDIAVLGGTEVHVRVFPTLSPPGGRLKLHESIDLPLTREADGTLTTSFVVDRDGFYRVELDGPQGEQVAASPQYVIDVLGDDAPAVSFAKPGRDTTASPIDEVFVEARAADDFGIGRLDLVYSVNGGAEQTLSLFSGGSRPLSEVSAGHTFYLEELSLEPGDFVSYYARAADNDRVQGPKRATSDLYFLQIRPFRKEFRPAMSAGGGGGGMGGGGDVGALSRQQRQIVSATFNVIRDRATYTAEKFRENVVFLALAQGRLRDQVAGLVSRMNSRLVEPDPSFRRIAEILPQAVEEMTAAEKSLQGMTPDEALPPEQRALQHLQKAEEEYELQVSTGRNAGGGGGAGSIAEDLADLFELEMDKLANQYEMAQRAEQQQTGQQLDALMERLRELARRQEQELQRQRRRAAAAQGGQAGSGSQRALADEVEEAARRLERLSREQGRPDLAEAARRMQQAADAMRRASASGDARGVAEAGAALDRLRNVERQLQRERASRAEDQVRDALRTAEEIAREQQEIADQVRGLGSGQPSRDEIQGLGERKDALENRVAELERRLDRTAADIRRDEREAARKLQEAADGIRDDKIKEKIRYSKGMVRAGSPEFARNFEDDIGANLDELRETLADAVGALGGSKEGEVAEALERTRDIVRGLESMGERMRERGEEGSQGGGEDQGRQGSQGQSGESAGQGQGAGQPGEGQPGEGGRADGDGRGGIGDTEGPWGGGGGWGSRRPWTVSGDDVRQFRGEVRQWSSEVRELQQQLDQLGLEGGTLDEVLEALRELDANRVYQDAAELERLQTFVTEGLKRFEYDLRRRIETADEQLLLSGRDEVPQQFRSLVEEYYRSLSRQR